MVIQVSVSLFSRQDWIGEAQRYFGRRDPWILIGANFGMSNIACGIIFPYAMTTRKSGSLFFSRS